MFNQSTLPWQARQEPSPQTRIDNTQILGLAIIIILIAEYLKYKFEQNRRYNMCDFSQYEDYRRLQSAQSNKSSQNFSPIKLSERERAVGTSEIEQGLVASTGKKNYLRSQNLFSKFSETSM